MKCRLIICILAVLILATMYVLDIAYYYYMPPKEHYPYTIKKKCKDTLRIAFIGDSWAFMHTPYDYSISNILSEQLNYPVQFRSYGICGATSKDIYEQLFSNHDIRHFLSNGLEVCVISAGINDTYKKMSNIYYQKSMEYIIRFFITNSIYPIIIEIPDYNIEKAYRNQTVFKMIVRQVSMLLTGTNIDCKHDFRNALNDLLLHSNNFGHKVYVVRYKEWNSNYQKDLEKYYLPDNMHLDERGYALLDTCITEHISNIFYNHLTPIDR